MVCAVLPKFENIHSVTSRPISGQTRYFSTYLPSLLFSVSFIMNFQITAILSRIKPANAPKLTIVEMNSSEQKTAMGVIITATKIVATTGV